MGKNQNFQAVREKVEQIATNAQNRVNQLDLPSEQQATKRLLLLDIQNQKVLSLQLLDLVTEVERVATDGN